MKIIENLIGILLMFGLCLMFWIAFFFDNLDGIIPR